MSKKVSRFKHISVLPKFFVLFAIQFAISINTIAKCGNYSLACFPFTSVFDLPFGFSQTTKSNICTRLKWLLNKMLRGECGSVNWGV